MYYRILTKQCLLLHRGSQLRDINRFMYFLNNFIKHGVNIQISISTWTKINCNDLGRSLEGDLKVIHLM